MFGVDLSPAMCRQARAKARRTQLPLRVIQGDMRSFRLPEPVDLVLCEFDAVNHVPDKNDLALVAKAVARAALRSEIKRDAPALRRCIELGLAEPSRRHLRTRVGLRRQLRAYPTRKHHLFASHERMTEILELNRQPLAGGAALALPDRRSTPL
jgi:SAM-dependent methyltransferase